MGHVDRTCETKNAASTGIENGVKSAYETTKFQDEQYLESDALCKSDASVTRVPLDRRDYRVAMADGDVLTFRADEMGVVEAFDILCGDGRVLRFTKLMETIVPPLWFDEVRT